jgi:putative transposase
MLQRIIGWCKKIIKVGMQWVENKLLRQTRPSNIAVIVGAVADVARTRTELIGENALLRQQLVVLRRSVKRPN